MLLPDIWEVKLHGVFEPNVPNRERIVLQANQATDMSQFFLMLGLPTGQNAMFPVRDAQYWFGGIALNAGDWIVLFTGSGQAAQQRDASGSTVHTLFWGRERTIFTGGLVPVLIRAGGILIGGQPALPTGR